MDAATTNRIEEISTNENHVVRTNFLMRPVFKPGEDGGIPLVQGVADGIRRVIRAPDERA